MKLKKIVVSFFIFLYSNIYANNIIHHRDINSTIERLDTKLWDSVYYQYKLIDNIPYQYNKRNKKYFWNPIYPIYFYRNYIEKYKQTHNKIYLNYMNILTKAIIKKSYKNQNYRTFYYDSSGEVARMFHKHYSGLTNSYYVYIFSILYKITKNE